MRVVGVVVAALLTLGLAAFGIVTAQNAAGPSSLIALAAHVISPSQNAGTAPQAPASQAPAPVAQAHVVSTPVVQVAEATVTRSDAPWAAPTVLAQNAPAPAPAAPAAPAVAPSPPPAAKAIPTCSNPDALGLSRVVEIDTTGGPAFGTEHFKQYDFLRDKEVVLTFDDGPWPENTPMVLKALQDNCIKATFFEIGEHATWRPDLTRELVNAGMTVGSHTWSHKDLAKNPYAKDIEQAKQEIEMGVSAVHMAAAGGPIAPFFRFPDLQQPPELMTYLGTRNIAIFSTDIDTFDFKLRKPEEVIKSAMTKLAKNGKGILLMHDFQHATAEAMPELVRQLKAGGYKIVHMVPKAPVTTLAKYDDMVRAQDKFSASNNTRPESSVVKTISE
ncbi:MAG TPA: polysaccharide deacetylase family protein [Xanthobacteraceae bacterium]|nr:polysaccharide deacetylase family protein [Xanthobacteraceae bacterium]